MSKKSVKTGTITGAEIRVNLSDSSSHRSIDENGRLIVRDTLITRESVDPYYGREVPGFERFGLAPEKLYYIYRPAQELKKAIRKFDGIPVLDLHAMDNPGSEQKESRVGAVSNAKMDSTGTGVLADLSIWDQDAIDKINSGEKRELSAGYSADTYLKPGEFNGKSYDLVMKNLSINHLALVRKGRVPGAMVYDENPNFKEPVIMEKEEILKLLEPELEAAGLEKDAVEKIVLKIKEYQPEPKPEAPAAPEQDEKPQPETPAEKSAEAPKPAAEVHPKPEVAEDAEAKEKVAEKVEEVKEEVKPEPQPEPKAEEPKPEPKPEAVPDQEEVKKEELKETVKLEDMPGFAEAVKEAVKAALAEISEAKEAVEDVCGKMSAMDSAEDLYKAGCSYFGIKTEGRDPREFKILFEGAKAGMSKPTKTAVLDQKPEQPEVEEPDFLKNLPKRRY